MRAAPLLALHVLLALAPAARADSWFPPGPKVAVSEDGKWYVIVQPQEGSYGGGGFLLVKAGESKLPIPKPDERKGFESMPPLAAREGDTVVAKGPCRIPMELRCRNDGKGFVIFESYANVGYGISAAAYDGRGNEVWQKALNDFFPAARIEAFMNTTSSIWWYSGLWIDEEAGDLVVVVSGGNDTGKNVAPPSLLRVSLKDGASRPGKPEDLLSRIGRGTEEEQVKALDAAMELSPPGFFEAAKKGFGRPEIPLTARLRLAVALAKGGDLTGKDLLLVSVQEGTEKEARKYAVEHLPSAVGPAAIPVLREMLHGEAGDVWWAAIQGIVSLGAAAVPTFVEMLAEEGETSDYRGGAAHGLGRIGRDARPAIPALVKAVAEPNDYVANAAANAAIAIADPAELSPLFIPILEKGSTQDGRLASFFEDNPSRAAIPALIAALGRHDAGTQGYEHDVLIVALQKSSGASAGSTAAAWRAWWAKQPK